MKHSNGNTVKSLTDVKICMKEHVYFDNHVPQNADQGYYYKGVVS